MPVSDWIYMKKPIVLKLAILMTSLFSLSSHASGPNEITAFEVRSVTTELSQVCLKTYGGWSESKWICSASVSTADIDLAFVQKLIQGKQPRVVDDLTPGFSITALSNSLAIKNCDLSTEDQSRAVEIQGQIRALELQLRKVIFPLKHQCE